MNKILLTQMIELAATNQNSKRLANLALQIAVDPELDDYVTIESFNNEQYEVGNIRLIKQCVNFNLK